MSIKIKKYKILGSSKNPESIALTIKGALVSLVPLLVIIFTNYNIDITSDEIMEVINAIFAVVGSIMVMWGIVRKVYYKYFL